MRILVTGGAGFIGSHITDALLADGHTVAVLDNLSSGHRSNLPSDVALFADDITTAAAGLVIEEFRPHCVFHLAAQISVRASVADPIFDAHTNVLGTIRVFEAAVRAGAHTVILASTGGAIYGDQPTVPTSEAQPPYPESPYGLSKLAAENYLEYIGRKYSVRTVSLRYSNVYGPRQDPHGEAGVVAIFAERLVSHQPLLIYGDGTQTRDYIYVGDVVRANLEAMHRSDVHGTFNIGTGIETDVNTLADKLVAMQTFRAPIEYAPARLGEQHRSAIAIDRARTILGFRPETSLDEGLGSTLTWFGQRQRSDFQGVALR